MKRLVISLAYWLVCAIVAGLVLVSLGYNFASALLMGVLFIPTALAAKYFGARITFDGGAKHWVWPVAALTLALLAAQYLLIFIANYYLLQVEVYVAGIAAFPPALRNPVFLLLIMALFIVPERFVSAALGRNRYVEFVSGRRRVRIEADAIACIESNDTEVTVHLADGVSYPTRATISTWEKMLDDRFLRVHRSFIVNRALITSFDSRSVTVGDRQIEISRKYRETVRRTLSHEGK